MSCDECALYASTLESRDRNIEDLHTEITRLKDDLQFVERWANHHAQKPHMDPQSALSCIQHYPSILEITRSYKDGKPAPMIICLSHFTRPSW